MLKASPGSSPGDSDRGERERQRLREQERRRREAVRIYFSHSFFRVSF